MTAKELYDTNQEFKEVVDKINIDNFSCKDIFQHKMVDILAEYYQDKPVYERINDGNM